MLRFFCTRVLLQCTLRSLAGLDGEGESESLGQFEVVACVPSAAILRGEKRPGILESFQIYEGGWVCCHALRTRWTGGHKHRRCLSSPVYADQLDYTVFEDGRAIGRMYEDKQTRPELRWFWSITVIINSGSGIVANGRMPTLEAAKAQFITSWDRARAAKE